MEELVTLLRNKKLTIGSAESLTGGLFASEIVSIPHASEVYLGSIVSYANSVKEGLLEIGESVIMQEGVISEKVVYLMAQNAARLLKSDITVSFSGNAGPVALEGKPVGAVYSCIKIKENYHVYYDEFKGNRDTIRMQVVYLTKERIITLINEKGD